MNFEKKGSIPIESVADPRTGETVHRVAIDPKGVEEIDNTIKKHQQTMNDFVMGAQSFFVGLKYQLDLIEKIKVADDSIKKTLAEVQRKAKLDPKKPWAWNLHLKSFEYRTPPVVQGMSEVEIKASQNPGQGPIVVNNQSIGVK